MKPTNKIALSVDSNQNLHYPYILLFSRFRNFIPLVTGSEEITSAELSVEPLFNM